LLLADLITALMLLTRLPVGRFGGGPDLGRCVWAFPVVGLFVGGTGSFVYAAAHWVGMPPLLGAAWTLAATLLVTGALHEDGLADTADGFGGGGTPARKLEIMRDSRIGSYGTLALVLSVGVRVAAIAALGQPRAAAAVIIPAAMIGRGAMLVLLLWLPPARGDGMGAAMGKPQVGRIATGLAVAAGAALLLMPPRAAIAAVVLGFGSSLVLGKTAMAQIGGYTGDVLGAAEVLGECVVLTAAVSAGI
jgi:adenosylcobinamide-GDP ribazoletransferase